MIKTFSLKSLISLVVICVISMTQMQAQQGRVTINQSPEIDKLLRLKKDMNVASERFKIQIYSGNRSAAEAAKANFIQAYPQYPTSLEYETPNYKVWIGNFRSSLEADRALLKVRRKFTSAFKFKPSK